MIRSALATGMALSLLLLSSVSSAAQGTTVVMDLEPAVNGAVSAGGRFPSQEMEDAFKEYVDWTEGHGLRGAAAMKHIGQQLEPAMNGGVASHGLFPSQSMEDQYRIYLDWTSNNGLSGLYAFGRS